MAVIEIQTIERSKRLEWVPIYSDTDTERAIRWGSDLLTRVNPKPLLRILNRQDGDVIGAWQERGYEPKADTDEPKDSITFNTDDLGPATDIDGNPLADTDEGSEQ